MGYLMSDFITREEARQQKLTRYFNGLSCKHGHIAERLVSTNACVVCSRKASAQWKIDNREAKLASSKRYYQKNKEKITQSLKQYRIDQKEHFWDNRKRWISENIESVRKWKADWKKRNPAKVTLDTVNRNAAKLKRTPSQLNDGHLFEMECVYTYCAGLRKIGLDYQVDHIVPLRGKIVSGLHVPWNLQVIPGVENMSKGNKYGV